MNSLMKIFFLPVAILFFCGCQPDIPFACGSNDVPGDIDTAQLVQFDTDFLPNAGYASRCEDSPRFDNRFSPYVGGTQSVDVVVEHFSFLGCPHCSQFSSYTRALMNAHPQIKSHVRFYFHHYPFSGYEHYHAAAFAASMQGMEHFWKMTKYLQGNAHKTLSYQELRDFAQDVLALDMNLYDAATLPQTEEGAFTYAFLEYEKETARANCVLGTPTVYVCGQQIYSWMEIESILLEYFEK